MEKIIDTNAYYVESRKAVNIALAKDARFRLELEPKELLEIYTRYLKETKNPQEYKVIKGLKEELEMKIKFNDTAKPVVPEDAQEKIRRNLEIEQQAAVEKTNELKAQLSDLIAEFEREALPLIKAVGEMESLQVIPTQIDVILSHQLRDKHEMGIQARFNSFQLGIQERLSRDAHKQLENSMSYLRGTTTPAKPKKSLLLNFLKGGK